MSKEAGRGAARRGPLAEGVRPVAGSLRLIAVRAAVVVLAATPALLAGVAGVAGGPARRPFYTGVEGRLPLDRLVRLLGDVPEGLLPAALASIALAVLADQVVTGGALALLDPERPEEGRVKVLPILWRDGLVHLWPFLRAAGLGLVLWAIGSALLRIPMRRLDIMGYRAGWTGEAALLTWPLVGAAATLLWLASVGAWVFWCRLITAADGRRRVRRTGLLVLRVFRRHPLRSWGAFVALTVASTLASGAVLLGWRYAEPKRVGGALLWLSAWLLTVLAQAFVWHWLLRAGRLLYASEGLADVRAAPDDPLRPLARVKAWWRRRREKAAPLSAG